MKNKSSPGHFVTNSSDVNDIRIKAQSASSARVYSSGNSYIICRGRRIKIVNTFLYLMSTPLNECLLRCICMNHLVDRGGWFYGVDHIWLGGCYDVGVGVIHNKRDILLQQYSFKAFKTPLMKLHLCITISVAGSIRNNSINVKDNYM